MAENTLSRVARIDSGFFNDDDPLAELARIVGQDPSRERVAPPVVQSREPEFDLEDELLREFERFDAPFRDAARAVSQSAQKVEPSFAEAPYIAPVAEVVAPAAPVPVEVAYVEPVQPAFVAEMPNVSAKSTVEDAGDIVFQAPAFDLSDFGLDTDDAADIDDPFFSELANVASPAGSAPAIKQSSLPPLVNIAPVEPVSAYAEWKTDRLTGVSAPHEAAAPVWRAEPVLARPETLDETLLAELPAAQPEPVTQPVFATPAAPPIKAPATYSATPFQVSAIPVVANRPVANGLTDMLADVERFPIPARSQPAVPAEPVVRQSLATPTLQQNSFAAPQTTPVKPVQATPAINLEDVSADPFENADFQFDLDSIEQELSDIHAAPSVSRTDAGARSGWEAASANKTTERTLHFDPSQIAEAEDHLESVSHLEVPSLPVVEKDDHKPATPDYYMEIDTEMGNLFSDDMAASPANTRAAPASSTFASPKAAVPFEAKLDRHLEEFERELEEDFRQSLLDGETLNSRERVNVRETKVSPRPDYDDEAEYGRRRGGVLVAAAFTGLVIVGSLGYYLWNNTGLKAIATSGEPRIILADKEPSKVVPEDKGGQTVPNQDKAVYDKVAGANTVDPKQKALISSSETPVDVVQKTLAPEPTTDAQLQELASNQTETADTQDSRLLPDAQEANASNGSITPAAEQPSIAPRKVKTMIVKADGTLVQREDDPLAPQAASSEPVKPDATKTVTEVANAEAAKVPAPVVPTDPSTKLPKKNDARVAVNDTASSDATLAEAASADVPLTVPAVKVKTVKTTTSNAPVPVTRPADQPVNVVGTVTDQGNVVADAKPAKQQAAPKPVDVAAADPAPVAAPTTASTGGSYGMQIASLPSQEEANRSMANLQKKFGSVIGGRSLEIRKADIAGKGTFYRVRVSVGSKDAAAALCEQYRAAGGSCLISK